MNCALPQFLWLLLVVPPLLLVFLWWSARERERLIRQFIQARLLPGLLVGVSRTRQKLRSACLVGAVGALLFALARPQWGFDWQEVSQSGLDIVVAIDTSKSMLAEDIAPNRLARAKLAALDLMQQAKSDRLGLVAFAGSAFLQCPLTIDDAAFRQSLDAVNVGLIPDGGTAIGEAIQEATRAFKEGENHKILVLLTDGEDQDSDALEAAKKAKAAGVTIFTVGIGSVEGELLRIKDAVGKPDYVRDENGNVVKSHLNEALLQQIAAATDGGFYLPLRGANTMDMLYQKGIAPLPKSQMQEKLVKRPMERYHWPLGLAIALLMTEMLFPERRREPRKAAVRPVPAVATLLMGVLILWLQTSVLSASPSTALREYNSGHFDQAQQEYERVLQQRTNDLRLHFNAGAAAYKDQHLQEAEKHFDQALMSPDLNLQQQAYYNLGNTLYHLGDQSSDPEKKKSAWENAIKKYENAIQLTTNNADARFNEALVKRRLEELKQEQQKQQQKNSDQQQSNQDQQQNGQGQKDQQQKDQQQKDQQQKDQQQSAPQPQTNSTAADQKPKPSKPDSSADKQEAQKSAARQAKPPEDQPQPGEDQSTAQANAAGQMTPQEAKQLLDAQKNDELLMPVSRKEKATNSQKVLRDW